MQAKAGDFAAVAGKPSARQLRPEKPKACASEPKPPRLTLLELDSDDGLLEEERLEESPPKKL
jgi:hypothetical protein